MDQRRWQLLACQTTSGRNPWSRLIVGMFVFVSCLAQAGRTLGDLSISGYEDRLHDRFYIGPDRAFIGEPYRWSGIGRMSDPTGAGDTNWKTVTMISDNWFITDFHHHPTRLDDPAGAAPIVRFYRTNDPWGDYWDSPLAVGGDEYQGVRVGNSDLWVGRLANTPPDWVLRYPLAKRQEGTNYLSYTDNDLFVFGQDSPRSQISVRVGRNEINELSLGGEYFWNFDPATGFGRDEAQTESGDSGSPSFFISGVIPVLAGTHTSNNYDTGVSANLSAIKAAVGEMVSVSSGLVGDLNGDNRVNLPDLSILANNLRLMQTGRYYMGDVTGDGNVNYADLAIIRSAYGKTLFAPTDFNRDRNVDGKDLATIAANWNQSVAAFTAGDADGNSLVNLADVVIFDKNERRAFFGPLPPPLSPVKGDFDGNGIIDGADTNTVHSYLNQQVPPGTNGDVDGNGLVDTGDLVYVLLHSGESFGDINSDQSVGPGDFAILANHWGQTVSGGRFLGDMNGDGSVNDQDATVLFQWWSVSAGGFAPVTAPEPSSIALAFVGAWLLCLLRNGRRGRR